MSADFYIHIFSGITKEDYKAFFSNCLGSKHFDLANSPIGDKWFELALKIESTPRIFVGEVSWMKASLFGDESKTYIPSTVEIISGLIGEETVITNKLIKEIKKAFKQPNTTNYRVANDDNVIKFLKKYYGKRIFTVSW